MHGRPLVLLKILVAGGFGVGKTTFVASLSEIPPLSTEQEMTGRITVDDQLILYLFGTPGQTRFWFMWDELARGAVGAVVLVDLRRPGDCYAAIDYVEDRRVPFAVAVNQFAGSPAYSEDTVRDALALRPDCPLLLMDARASHSSLDTLITLVEHALVRSTDRVPRTDSSSMASN